ncbi:MAG: hypothetical protein ACOZCL_18805 [Bacillota bacterium]
MRKRIIYISLLLIFTVLLQMLSPGANAGQYERDGDLKINVDIGYNSFYKIGSTIPFFFEIENNLKDINGELQLEMPDEYNNINIYSIEVNLPKNSTKQFIMNVPVVRYVTKINASIVEGKKKLITKILRPTSPFSADTLTIGLISDDYESIRYIDKIPVPNNRHSKTHTLSMDEKNLPSDREALKLFNVIVISNFDTSRLSKEQYSALKQWVSGGGVLILGTGPAYTKTLAVFKDDFLTGEMDEVQSVETAALNNIMNNAEAGAAMVLDVLSIRLKDSVVLAESEGIPLVQKVDKDKGVVAVAAFDFGMEPLAGWIGNKAFAESLIGKLLPGHYNSAYYEKQTMMRDNLYPIDNSLRSIPELPQPKPLNLLYLFLLYIFIVAPLSYFILKRLDRREFMWVTVPVIAVVFSILVYYFGFGTRLTEPMANIISLVEVDNSGVIEPKTYAGIFTPNKMDMRVEAEEGVSMRPLTFNTGYMYGPPANESEQGKVISKITLSPSTAIEYYRTGVWSMKNIILDSDKGLKGSFDAKLNYTGSSLTGNIKNNTGFDLYECYIVTENQFFSIGELLNGESVNINEKLKDYYSNRYDLMNAIYKDPYSVPASRLTEAQLRQQRENMQKRQILEYYYWGADADPLNAKLFAWSKTPLTGELFVNGKRIKKIEKSFITTNIALDFKQGSNVYYPMGFIKPTVINNMTNGHYDEMSKFIYGSGSVELSYEIDKGITVSEVQVRCTAKATNADKFIYNYQLKDWERIYGESFTANAENIDKYVSESSTLMLKIDLAEGEMPLPQISVKGSVK